MSLQACDIVEDIFKRAEMFFHSPADTIAVAAYVQASAAIAAAQLMAASNREAAATIQAVKKLDVPTDYGHISTEGVDG